MSEERGVTIWARWARAVLRCVVDNFSMGPGGTRRAVLSLRREVSAVFMPGPVAERAKQAHDDALRDRATKIARGEWEKYGWPPARP